VAVAAGLDLEAARRLFAESQDFTIGLEEEFAIVEPESLELAHAFEEVYAMCAEDELLAQAAAGELIDTEIEIRSGRGEDFAHAMSMQLERRRRLFAVTDRLGYELAAMGTHPWASYLDQRIIDTDHYNLLSDQLRWVAQRNNTWSNHVHVGIRDADRAIAVCDYLRELLPPLLALSANSPFLDGHDTGLASIRTQIFTRSFPRCGVHEPFGDWDTYAKFIENLKRSGTVTEPTQLWWSVRPHHRFGTVELRICDAQTDGDESFGLAGLIGASIVQSALDHDAGLLPAPLPGREVEENLWRAIRHGMDGQMIDWRGDCGLRDTRDVVAGLVEWSTPARERIQAPAPSLAPNGAQRARAAMEAGADPAAVYREAIAQTRRTYLARDASPRAGG